MAAGKQSSTPQQAKRPMEDEDERASKRREQTKWTLEPFDGKGNIEMVQVELRSMEEFLEDYRGIERLLQLSHPDSLESPLVKSATHLAKEFNGLNDMFKRFVETSRKGREALEATLNFTTRDIVTQDKWWERTNILSNGLVFQMLTDMLERAPPTDPDAYSHYLRTKMYELPLELDNGTEAIDGDRLMEEIDRVYDMPGGEWLAFKMWLDVKIDILQDPHVTNMPLHRYKYIIKEHRKIDAYFRDMLLSRGWYFSGVVWLGPAQICRRLRERMQRHECSATTPFTPCVFNMLLPTLDFFQRIAYSEIQETTLSVVENRLPAELANLVVEYTLAAEEMPEDPRILVAAKHRATSEVTTACRMPCPHMGQHLHANEVLRITYSHQYAFGPDWIAREPLVTGFEDFTRYPEDEFGEGILAWDARGLPNDWS